MIDHHFQALGTHWSLSIDEPTIPSIVWQHIEEETAQFEQEFSRFISTSQVSAFTQSSPGTYQVSTQFSQLLSFAQELKHLTHGSFDPAIGGLLEAAGYDRKYSLQPKKDVSEWKAPAWSIKGDQLTIDGPVQFDLGAFGKGYWIDQISALIREAGYEHFMVEGGGDMFGSTKKDGSAWQLAIEWPGKPEYALGTVELKNQALAVSDVFKRRWGKWHHILNPKTAVPLEQIVGCSVMASAAQVADGLTTVLVFVDTARREEVSKRFHVNYTIVYADNTVERSEGWSGELFV